MNKLAISNGKIDQSDQKFTFSVKKKENDGGGALMSSAEFASVI